MGWGADMIWDFIIDFFTSMWTWFAAQIPTVEITLDVGAYAAPMANLFGYIDTFVSLDVIVLCITTILIVDNWALIVKLAIRVWEMIPFN